MKKRKSRRLKRRVRTRRKKRTRTRRKKRTRKMKGGMKDAAAAGGGAPRSLARVNNELFGKYKHVDMEVIKGVKGDSEFEIKYKGNIFHISIPKKYPWESIKINGFKMQWMNVTEKITGYIDKLISPDSKTKNTLIYCHKDPAFHWMMNTWISIFGENFSNSKKMYLDIVEDGKGQVPDTIIGDGFDDEILTKNTNLWDFIMVPDCDGALFNLTINSQNRVQDAELAFTMLQKMLRNLKIGGILWFTKTMTPELFQKMHEGINRGEYKINYLQLAPVKMRSIEIPEQRTTYYIDFPSEIEPEFDPIYFNLGGWFQPYRFVGYEFKKDNPFKGREDLVELGKGFQETDNIDNAILAYEQALQDKTISASTWYQLGMCHMKNGDNNSASLAFDSLIDYSRRYDDTASLDMAQEALLTTGVPGKWISGFYITRLT
jgi:tetratricopeptide (TPR) repeat protein